MSEVQQTHYADVANWALPDSPWERIDAVLPKPPSRYRGRRKKAEPGLISSKATGMQT